MLVLGLFLTSMTILALVIQQKKTQVSSNQLQSEENPAVVASAVPNQSSRPSDNAPQIGTTEGPVQLRDQIGLPSAWQAEIKRLRGTRESDGLTTIRAVVQITPPDGTKYHRLAIAVSINGARFHVPYSVCSAGFKRYRERLFSGMPTKKDVGTFARKNGFSR